MNQTETGMILYVREERNFGFIVPDGAESRDDNIFFSTDALINCDPSEVRRGTKCNYIRFQREDGRSHAIRVIVDDEYLIRANDAK